MDIREPGLLGSMELGIGLSGVLRSSARDFKGWNLVEWHIPAPMDKATPPAKQTVTHRYTVVCTLSSCLSLRFLRFVLIVVLCAVCVLCPHVVLVFLRCSQVALVLPMSSIYLMFSSCCPRVVFVLPMCCPLDVVLALPFCLLFSLCCVFVAYVFFSLVLVFSSWYVVPVFPVCCSWCCSWPIFVLLSSCPRVILSFHCTDEILLLSCCCPYAIFIFPMRCSPVVIVFPLCCHCAVVIVVYCVLLLGRCALCK